MSMSVRYVPQVFAKYNSNRTHVQQSSSFLQMESLRRQAESNRKAHQSDMRRQLQRGADKFTDSDLDEGAQSYSSAGKGSSSSRNNKGSSDSHSPSKAIRSGGKKSTGGASSLRLHDLASFSDEDEDGKEAITARDIESTAEEEVEVAAVVRAAEEERNKQLQAEIRALESETLRLERQWRARAEAEEKSVLSAVAVEEEHSQVRRQRLLRGSNNTGSSRTGGEEDAAELVVKREQLIQQLQALRVEHERTAQEEKELTDEIQVYRDGVAAHKERVHDKQEQHRLRLRELQLEFGPKLRELKEQIDVLTTQLRDETERCRRQAAATDKEHAAELAKLDEQVCVVSFLGSLFLCNAFFNGDIISWFSTGEDRDGATGGRNRELERSGGGRRSKDCPPGETHQAVQFILGWKQQ